MAAKSKFFPMIVPILCILSLTGRGQAEDQVILDVMVNGQNVGQAFLWLTEAGDVLVPHDLFSGLRLKKKLLADQKSGKISLKHLSHALKFEVDHNNAVLTITVAPQWFESQIIRPQPPALLKRSTITKAQPFSGFINYQIESEYIENDAFKSYNLPWEVGFNREKWFAFSNFRYRNTDGKDQSTRLMTNLIMDDSAKLYRLTFGDFSPPGTAIIGSDIMGGISWDTRFALNRYFKPYPGMNADFVLETPAHAQLYSDGNLIKEWDLLPGPVRLEELNTYAGGSAELVLRDVFGRERRIDLPQLFGGQDLLRKGVHEYSYNMGFLRENFGTESSKYGDFAGIAFHRYGFADWFTGGISAAFQENIYNAGLLAGIRLSNDHLISSEAMFSQEKGNNGSAVSTRYAYRNGNFSGGLSLLLYSRDFRSPLNSDDAEENKIQSLRYQWNLTASHSWQSLGGVSFSYANNDYREGTKEETSLLTLSYSKSFYKQFNLFISMKQGIQGLDNQEIYLGFQYTPSNDRQKRFYDNIAYRYKDAKGEDRQQEVSVQKHTGLGKGFGYSLTAFHNGREIGGSGKVGYRHELGIAEVLLRQPSEGKMAGNVSWTGGIGIIDNGVYFGRPVIDSFAIVEVDGLDEVPVYSGSSLAGETGMNGRLMIPELVSYNDNRILIRPRDLPIDYELTGRERVVEMEQRGAAIVKFKASRFTAVEGNLYIIASDGIRESLDTVPISVEVNGELRNSFTGQNGYFYLENLPPGEYVLRIYWAGDVCNARIIVPENEAIVNNIEDVICEPAK
ncbi:fimbria/pilus outer membrane usher protein [Desulfobacterales bacterium HSG16]|nr:fimbria/pilus outer membrane usher protein [Desulfobacterales bacterium HSG16]